MSPHRRIWLRVLWAFFAATLIFGVGVGTLALVEHDYAGAAALYVLTACLGVALFLAIDS